MSGRRYADVAKLALCAKLAPCAMLALCSMSAVHAADEPGFWQAQFPDLQNPAAEFRPKVRTRADPANLQALADAGFGAAEIGVDFSADATTARSALDAVLESAHRVGLHVDLAPGGSQPYVSPGIDEANSMQQLVGDSVAVSGPRMYVLRPVQPTRLAGHPRLVAITAARIVDDHAPPVVLDAGSAVDLTPHVDQSGILHWRVPPGRWRLFAFWQRATGQIMQGKPFETPETWSGREPRTGGGAFFTADIFSGKGIAAALAYLNAHFLTGDASLLRGGDLAHDSLEVQAELFWTADLPAEFRRRRGYSLIPYLPVLQIPKESSFDPLDPSWGGPLGRPAFDFAGDVGERIRYDYRQTLTDLYCDRYLSELSTWAHGKGMHSRVQVAYNYVGLDLLRSARAVDVAENESFDSGWVRPFDASIPAYGTDRWRHAMDSYRLTGSGAHLAGRRRATVEYGDDFAIYRKQPADYAQQLQEALAGGITMGLLTAFSSTDSGWPVPQGLAHIGLGDDWTQAWPQWPDWRRLNDYFARITELLESGQPRVDVAIYHDRGLSTVHEDAPLFAGGALEGAGFTFDFIDPAALSSDDAAAVDGALYGRGVGYRALILDHQSAIPATAARAILAMARRGLPIVILGMPPERSTGFHRQHANDLLVSASMNALRRVSNAVFLNDGDDVAVALNMLRCRPAAAFGAATGLLTARRQTKDYDLWWIFNPTNSAVSAEAQLGAVGTPYWVDLWSGSFSPVAQWHQRAEEMRVPVRIPPHQSAAVVIRHEEPTRVHAISSTNPLVNDGGDFVALADTPTQVAFSNGVSRTVGRGGHPQSMPLEAWHLHVDEFLPDGQRPHDLDLARLADWRQIAGLHDAVGSAVYTTAVRLTPDWIGPDRDTVLRVGELHGAMQLMVNDHLVTAQTVGDGEWLVGKWLQAGTNTVTIRVDTTLLNRMVALRASGDPRYQTGPTPLASAPSGLLGPVTLMSVDRISGYEPGR